MNLPAFWLSTRIESFSPLSAPALATRKETLGLALLRGKGAVLRPAAFGDVHARNGLDAVDHRLGRFRRKLAHRPQRAVDAQPHRVRVLVLRVDEDVAGPLLQGVVDNLNGQVEDMPVSRTPCSP